jgi:hypothetical protein
MTGTNQPLGTGVTGLTLDLLAERIEHEKDLREAAEESAAEALRTATGTLEKRLEGMNEFRAQLTTQTATFVSVDVFNSKMDALSGRINLLERSAERMAGSLATWRFLAGGGGILGLVSIALWLIHPGTAATP